MTMTNLGRVTLCGEEIEVSTEVEAHLEGKDLCLKGALQGVVDMACLWGWVQYFPRPGLYGVTMEVVTAAGRVRFLWLFAEFEAPHRGRARPLGWMRQGDNLVGSCLIPIAECVALLLGRLLEEYRSDPAGKRTWEGFSSEDRMHQVNWWLQNLMPPEHPPVCELEYAEPAEGEVPQVEAILCIFVDGSAVRLSGKGVAVVESDCQVIVREEGVLTARAVKAAESLCGHA